MSNVKIAFSLPTFDVLLFTTLYEWIVDDGDYLDAHGIRQLVAALADNMDIALGGLNDKQLEDIAGIVKKMTDEINRFRNIPTGDQ